MPAARRRRAAAPQRPELATVWGPVDTLPDGEDCLTLHVWTPGLDNAQAPGDGLAAWRRLLLRLGQLAALRQHQPRAAQRRRGGRGQPSPQHLRPSRSLGAGGERFAQSGNAGVLDLVAALEWVRDHAARFGGDPGNVTIFGQSGGGGKVSALLAMPRAKGLFHKAIVQSGASVRFAERERTTRLADAVLKQLGLGADELDKLQAVPMETLQAAVAPAQATLPQAATAAARPLQFRAGDRRQAAAGPALRSGGAGDLRRRSGAWSATPRTRPRSSSRPTTRCGTARSPRRSWPSASTAVAGGHADKLLAYYKRAATPADRLITALTASNFGVRSIMLAERKAARGKAPVWTYDFAWETPAFGGRLKSCHSVEVPFVFDTLHVIGEHHRSPAPRHWPTACRRPGPPSPAPARPIGRPTRRPRAPPWCSTTSAAPSTIPTARCGRCGSRPRPG